MCDAAIGQRRGRGGAPGEADHAGNEATALTLLRAGPDQPNLLGGSLSWSGTSPHAKHAGASLPQLFSTRGKKLTPHFFAGNFQVAHDLVAANSGCDEFQRGCAARQNENNDLIQNAILQL